MLTQEALAFAIDRIESFYTVHQHASLEEKTDAVGILLDGLGMTDDLKCAFAEWLTEYVGDAYEGAAMLGLLVGLFVKQHEDTL